MSKSILRKLEDLQETPPWEWEEEYVDVLNEGLADGDSEVRRLAAGLCHHMLDDDLTRVLLRLVQTDPVAEVASVAAVALGPGLENFYTEYDEEMAADDPDELEALPFSPEVYEEVCQTLRQVYEDSSRPSLVRRRALEAAVRAQQDWHEEAIREAHESGDVEWQATAVFCMGYIPGFEGEILDALHSDLLPVKREALVAAGEQVIDEAGAEVMRVAGDSSADLELRLAAISALEVLDPPNSQELLEGLTEDENPEIADAAEASLEEREVFAAIENEDWEDDWEEGDDEDDEGGDEEWEDEDGDGENGDEGEDKDRD